VGDRDLGNEGFGGIDTRGCDLFAETSNFSDLLEVVNFLRFITIYTQPSRVVATVLFTGKAIAKNLKNLLACLYDSSIKMSKCVLDLGLYRMQHVASGCYDA
jgi:hypothetical protein